MSKVSVKSFEFPQEPICHTCKNKIDFLPFRNVFLNGRHGISQVLFFHYFFPCWNMDYMTQTRMAGSISQAGLTFDSDCLPSEESMINYKKNIELWIKDGY